MPQISILPHVMKHASLQDVKKMEALLTNFTNRNSGWCFYLHVSIWYIEWELLVLYFYLDYFVHYVAGYVLYFSSGDIWYGCSSWSICSRNNDRINIWPSGWHVCCKTLPKAQHWRGNVSVLLVCFYFEVMIYILQDSFFHPTIYISIEPMRYNPFEDLAD